jgi:hypothetical protein
VHRRDVKVPVVSWEIWQKVLRVHECEEPSSWYVHGWDYSGGLGWKNALWPEYKAPWMPSSMGDAKPLWQAWAMAHFVTRANGGFWPDQVGCPGY